MEIVNSAAQAYAERFSSSQSDLLQEIEADTRRNHPHAQMLSGHLQGRLLAMISRMVRPSRILEIGTFTGFSALCLAEGLAPGGRLHTIELREEDALTASRFFNRSVLADKINLHIGNALEIIETMTETWDLVFIDADKTGYLTYFHMILSHVRPGGFILADNTLFHGEVLQDPVTGKNAKAIHEFNEAVGNDDRVESVMLTVRDGLLLIRKK